MSNWNAMRREMNDLHKRISQKPDSEKMGFAVCPGGILNAYREGDVSFNDAVAALNEWNHQEAKPQTWREVFKAIPQCPQRQDATDDQLADLRMVANRLGFYDAADYLRPPHRQEAKPLTVDQIEEVIREQSQIHGLMLGSQRIEDMTTAIYDLVHANLPPDQSTEGFWSRTASRQHSRIAELEKQVLEMCGKAEKLQAQRNVLEETNRIAALRVAKLQADRDALVEFIETEAEALDEAGMSTDGDRFREFVARIKAGQA